MERQLLPITVFFLFLFLLVFSGTSGTRGAAASVPSNATVPAFMSLGISNNLSAGVLFGGLGPNTNDNNATDNYAALGNSTYYVYSFDSNTLVDFCTSDDAPLSSGGGLTIGNGNYTFNDSLAPNGPGLPGTVIGTAYQKLVQQGVAQNVFVYLRFWLDVPASQPAGNYVNTLSFKVVAAGQSC